MAISLRCGAQNPGDEHMVAPIDVHYMAVEEGYYGNNRHGVTMEAVRTTSTVTDRRSRWRGEKRALGLDFSVPVVLGQVMTENDVRWSTFWSRGNTVANPATRIDLYVGKHVGSDTALGRTNETIGYVVVNRGFARYQGTPFWAGVGQDIVQGMGDQPPYEYRLFTRTNMVTAIAVQAAMDNGDGAWAVLYGDTPVTSNSLFLAVDEDQIGDEERSHGNEQVSYIVWAGPGETSSNRAPVAIADRAETVVGEAVMIPVLSNDSDPDDDPLRIAGVSQPTHGAVEHDAEQVRYQPAPSFVGKDQFNYVVDDGRGGMSTGVVTVHVRQLESVSIVRAPGLIRSTGTYEVIVAYVSSGERDLLVRLMDAPPEATVYGSIRNQVERENGDQAAGLTVYVPAPKGSGYVWNAQLLGKADGSDTIYGEDEKPVVVAPDIAASTLVSVTEGYEIRFAPAPDGVDYTVEYRDTMEDGVRWQPLPGGPHDRGSVVDKEVEQTMRRYYRIEISVEPSGE